MKNMKSLVMMMFVAMLVLVGCGADGSIKEMSGEDLVKNNSDKNKDKMLLIDVRPQEEYLAGHIPHAINIFIEDLEARLSEIEDYKNEPVVLYCNSGNKSGKAAEILVENGFTDVTNAEGVKDFSYNLVTYADIRGAELEELVKTTEDIVLVDTRPVKDVNETGMIEGAINIPFDEVQQHLNQLPKDKIILLYCSTGTKSANVAQELVELGYTKVINSIDGVKEYDFANLKK